MQQPQKPIFTESSPQQQNITTILSSLQKQQHDILKLLNKYKQSLPEDGSQDEHQKTNRQKKHGREKEKQKEESGHGKKDGGNGIKKSKKKNGDAHLYISKTARVYGNDNTISYTKQDENSRNIRAISNKNEKISSPNQIKVQLQNSKIVKLPLVKAKGRSRANSIQQKSNYGIQYQKADHKYNENVVKFYQNLRNRAYSNIPYEKQIIQQKQANSIKNRNKIKKSKNKNHNIKLQVSNLPNGLASPKPIQQNIFDIHDADLESQSSSFPPLTQISKPLSIRPYTNFDQLYNPNQNQNSLSLSPQTPSQKQSRLRSSLVSISTSVSPSLALAQKPSQVSMSFYIRTFNQKFMQQCQQQINYLFFSRSQQPEYVNGNAQSSKNKSRSQKDKQENNNNGNFKKQWAQGILKMFQKHDEQIQKMHKDMRYLEGFDEGYFAGGIYGRYK